MSVPSTSSGSVSTVTGPYWKYLVKPNDIMHGEYEYNLRVQSAIDFAKPKSSKPNKSQLQQYNAQCRQYEQYMKDMAELDVLTTALIRTSGGLVKVNSVRQITELMFDKWCLNYKDRLHRFIPVHVYQQCIDIQFDNGLIYLLVTKTPEFITTNTHLQTRADGCNLPINYYRGVVDLLSQPITPPVQISMQQSYNYGDIFPYSETKNIEFKCFTTTSVSGLMKELTGGRNHGLLFGFGNTRGGGYAMVGIYEDTNTGTTLVYGQPLLQHELPFLETVIRDFLTEDSTGSNRIWGTEGYKPQKGTDWDIEFVPVTNGPVPCHPNCKSCGHSTRYLVIIHIHQFAGGVFEKTPESYQINDDGDIQQTTFSTWKRKHQISAASTTGPAGSQATQSMTIPAGSQATQLTTSPAGSQTTQSTSSPAGSQTTQSTTSPAGSQITQSTTSPAGSQITQSTTCPAGYQIAQSTTSTAGSKTTLSTTSPAGSQATQSTASTAGSQATQSTASTAGSQATQSTTSPAGSQATQSTASTAGSQATQSTASTAGSQATQSTTSPAGSQITQSTTSTAGSQTTQSTTSPAVSQTTQSTTSPATVTPQLPGNTLSYKHHSSDWKSRAFEIPTIRELTEDVVNAFDMFKMSQPMNVTPSWDTLNKNHPNLQSVLSRLDSEMGESFAVVASPSLFQCFNCDMKIPQCPHLVADIMSMNTEGKLLICSVCEEGGSPQEEVEQVTYGNILGRVVKKKLLQIEGKHMDHVVRLYIHTRVYRLTGIDHIPRDDIVTTIFSGTTKDVNSIKTRIAHLLLEKQGYLYDAVGEQVSLYFSPRQIAITLDCMNNDVSIITGAPGTGKSLVLQELCRMNGRDKSIYVCINQALAARVKHHNITDVLCVNDSHDLVQRLCDPLYVNRTLVAIDDAQLMHFSWDQSSVSKLCGNAKIKKVFALDSKFQSYQQHTCELVQLVENVIMETPYQKPLHDIYRNTEVVISYMISAIPEILKGKMRSKATSSGDDVRVTAMSKMSTMNKSNGILKHTQELCASGTGGRGYSPRDVAILVDRGSPHDTRATVELLKMLFLKHWPQGQPQSAVIYPTQGIIIDSLENFIGIDSCMILCPVWNESQLQNAKYRNAVSSRGIQYVEFLQPLVIERQLHGMDQVPVNFKQGQRSVSSWIS